MSKVGDIAGSVSREIEVNVSPTETFRVYGSLILVQLAMEAFPDKYYEFKVVKGDGGSNSIIEVFMVPGVEPDWYREEYMVVDYEKRIKSNRMLEGGVMDQGFISYVTTLRALEKEGNPNACIMTGTIDYVVKDASSLPVVQSSIDGLYGIMTTVAAYVTKYHAAPVTN
ncbi:S-norcoclaurine synthase 2 [Sesamum angolense]|uniref:S-norcoclaurine synthase 2 n=1 Tax=Sesamum angolense TaxID=2727404 RepID=A0AAE1X2U1_9LAMI|nr:S-norcoclaurine synthase 2 [Sesamum angolense]